MAIRPKRRKYRDNPYTLNYCEERDIYKGERKSGRFASSVDLYTCIGIFTYHIIFRLVHNL